MTNPKAFQLLQTAHKEYFEPQPEDLKDSYFITRFREIADALLHNEIDEAHLFDLERMVQWTEEKITFYSSVLPYQEDLGYYYDTALRAYEHYLAGLYELVDFLDDALLARIENAIDLAEQGERIFKELELETTREKKLYLQDSISYAVA